MQARFLTAMLALSLALVWCTARAADEPATEKEIAELIAQLGAKSAAEGDAAFKRLKQIGADAVEQLKAACDSSNPKIRRRAELALAAIKRHHFSSQVQAILKGDADEVSLRSWTKYRQMVGDRQAARELFAAMCFEQPELIEAYEKGPEAATAQLKAYFEAVANKKRRSLNNNWSQPLGSDAVVLFLGSDKEIDAPFEAYFLDVSAWARHGQALDAQQQVAFKFVARWFARPLSGDFQHDLNRLRVAMRYQPHINKVAANLAVALFEKEYGNPAADDPDKQWKADEAGVLVYILGQIGDRSHIPLIEPLLKNKHVSQYYNRKFQIRDVALAAVVQLSGQELKDYGFTRRRRVNNNNINMLTILSCTFENNRQREQALAKWYAWAEENLAPAQGE